MAIKIQSQGQIPAIDLDHVQFDQLNVTVSRVAPYRIAMSAKTVLYGQDLAGVNYYDSTVKDISIVDMAAYIATLDPTKQIKAAAAMQKVQEGLGELAEIYHGYTFVQYE